MPKRAELGVSDPVNFPNIAPVPGCWTEMTFLD